MLVKWMPLFCKVVVGEWTRQGRSSQHQGPFPPSPCSQQSFLSRLWSQGLCTWGSLSKNSLPTDTLSPPPLTSFRSLTRCHLYRDLPWPFHQNTHPFTPLWLLTLLFSASWCLLLSSVSYSWYAYYIFMTDVQILNAGGSLELEM